MKSNKPLVSVLILNWNRLEDTKRAIESVLSQTYSNVEIVLIDNASTEPESDSLAQLYPSVRYYKMDKNYGCPGGRNRGIELCKGEYVFFVDNDGILEKNAVRNALEIFLENPEVGIVAGKVLPFDSIDEIIGNPLILGEKYDTSNFTGCVAMHKMAIYDKIGMFNEDFMYGAEETNLSYRLIAVGHHLCYSDNVILWHKKAETARNNCFNQVSVYSNKLVTYWELMPIKECTLISFWFIFNYTYHCFRKGCGMLFIKNMPYAFSRAYKARKTSRIRLTKNDVKYISALN